MKNCIKNRTYVRYCFGVSSFADTHHRRSLDNVSEKRLLMRPLGRPRGYAGRAFRRASSRARGRLIPAMPSLWRDLRGLTQRQPHLSGIASLVKRFLRGPAPDTRQAEIIHQHTAVGLPEFERDEIPELTHPHSQDPCVTSATGRRRSATRAPEGQHPARAKPAASPARGPVPRIPFPPPPRIPFPPPWRADRSPHA